MLAMPPLLRAACRPGCFMHLSIMHLNHPSIGPGTPQGFAADSGKLLWTASLPSIKGAAAVKAAPSAAGDTWVASLQPG